MFSNGKFGVRRSRPFAHDEYKDLSFPGTCSLWWAKGDVNFTYCMASEDVARKFIKNYKEDLVIRPGYLHISDEVIE